MTERQYPQIKHSHDIWHAAKNLGEKNCQGNYFYPHLVYFIYFIFNKLKYLNEKKTILGN